jgi:hypothetical protein
VPTAEPMAWNAAVEGAKMVTSWRASTVETRFACVSAPVSAVRLAAAAVAVSDSGMVRAVSIMWRTPPVKLRSWGWVLVSEESGWVMGDWQGSGKMRDVDGTYSSDDCALCQQTAEDLHTGAIESCLDSLASSHISVSCVHQQSGEELRRVRESRCWVRTIQNVVGQERSDEAGVGGCRLACRRVEERCQSLIVGCENGDVACAAES